MTYAKLPNGWILEINPARDEMFVQVYELTVHLILAVAA